MRVIVWEREEKEKKGEGLDEALCCGAGTAVGRRGTTS